MGYSLLPSTMSCASVCSVYACRLWNWAQNCSIFKVIGNAIIVFLRRKISLVFLSSCRDNVKIWILLDGEQIPVAESMHVSDLSTRSLSTRSSSLSSYYTERVWLRIFSFVLVFIKDNNFTSLLTLICLSLLMLLVPSCPKPNRSTAVKTKNASLDGLYQLRTFLLTGYVQGGSAC